MRIHCVWILALFSSVLHSCAFGTTWYVRQDGGTRYGTNTSTGQCNGQSDSPYPGAGINQACAFNDIHLLWDDNYTYSVQQWIIAGGDTVLIHPRTDSLPWRVGWPDQTHTNGGYGIGCWGVSNGPCTMPPLPSGTASQHTRLLGVNYADCNLGNRPDLTKMTPVSGGFGTYTVVNISGSQYVDVQCIEISSFSACQLQGAPQTHPCNRDSGSGGLSDYANVGIQTSNGTLGVTLQDIWVHGLNSENIRGALGAGAESEIRVLNSMSAQTGRDLDDGSDTAQGAVLNLTDTTIEFSGCQETKPLKVRYPQTDAATAQNLSICYDQSHGSVIGDAVGTRAGSGPDMHLLRFVSRFNTQDGFDPGHTDGGNHVLTIDRSLFYSNMAGAYKWGPNFQTASVTNTVAIVDCHRMANSLPGAPAGYNDNLSDFCRANSAVSVNYHNGGSISLEHDTIVSYMPITFVISCWETACSGTILTMKDNIIFGNEDLLASGYNGNSGGPGAFYWQAANPDGSSNAVGVPMSSVLSIFSRDHNLWYGHRNITSPTGYPNELVTDPLFVNEPNGNLSLAGSFAETSWDNFNFALSTNSPAVKAGVTLTGITIDYNTVPYGAPPSVGAVELGSLAPPIPGQLLLQGVIPVQSGMWKNF